MTYPSSRPFGDPRAEMRPGRRTASVTNVAPAEDHRLYRGESAAGSTERPRAWADEDIRRVPRQRARGEWERRYRSPGPARAVWLAAGLGLLVDGLAYTIAPHDYNLGLWLFWPAVALPFAVFAIVLLAGRPSPAVTQVTVAMVGLYPAVMYRLTSPLVLGGFDEHLHQRTLQDLLDGSGLFAANPLLAVSPKYPGMELFTGVVVRLTGLSAILAMSAVALLCRAVLVLTLYHAALTVSPSRRVASLVVLFYASSPQFFFFNAQFAYQTMALTLGIGGLYLLRRAQLTEGAAARRLTILSILALIATVVTHHITSWFVLGFLVSWFVVTPRARRRPLGWAIIAMGSAIIIWTAGIASEMATYLSPTFVESVQQSEALLGGTSQHALFSSAGVVEPEWQHIVLILYAMICSCAAITCGTIILWRSVYNRDGRLGLLGILSIIYPLTLAAHFVSAAAEIGDRASTFFFLPLALGCALVFLRDPRACRSGGTRARHILEPRGRQYWLAPLIALTSLAYLGGVVLGSGPQWEYLPGPYLVSAELRTQDPETLAAVDWAASHLPPGSRIVADRVPAALLAAQARLWPVIVASGNLQPASIYFSDTWSSFQTNVVRRMHIQYLYIDQRLSESLPQEGYYIYPGETPKPERISIAALTKFSHVPGLKVVYHHGPVTIYDTVGLGVKPEVDGFTGYRRMGAGTLGDGLIGAAAMAIMWVLRRRLRWSKSAARDAGSIGAATATIAAITLAGGVLFDLLLMPGPSFTAGALLMVAILWMIQHSRTGARILPRGISMRRLDPFIIAGILVGVAGVALAIHGAWATDVTAVDGILRTASGAWRH